MEKKNEIYGHVWEQVGVNSMAAYGDYDESSMFGYSTGMIIESYYKFFKLNHTISRPVKLEKSKNIVKNWYL